MTPPDDELDIDIRTTLDLGRAEHAHSFLALLERHDSDWMPTRFGPYEPLRHSFATEGAVRSSAAGLAIREVPHTQAT